MPAIDFNLNVHSSLPQSHVWDEARSCWLEHCHCQTIMILLSLNTVSTRVKSQYKNFDKSWWTYFVPCFILKKGTKYVRQDLSKVFVFWLDIVVEIDKIFMPVRGQHRPKRLQRKHVFNVCMHARWCTCLCMYLNPR